MISDYGKPWSNREDDQLNTLYNVDMLDVVEISKMIAYRSPYTIVGRLLEKKWIEYFESARGYAVYITTPEYGKYITELYKGLGGGTLYCN